MKSKILKIIIIISLFILFLFITAKSYANTVSTELSNNIFRLHIIANSDTEDDQELKLKVRDEIIEYMENLTENCETKDEVISLVNENIDEFYNIAQSIISDNGYNYQINIEIGNFYFPTKVYGNISLPSGFYDALKIEIGEAKGENWWCSLFPPLCFTDISSGIIDEEADETLQNNLDDEEYSIITDNSNNYQIKFKILELFS